MPRIRPGRPVAPAEPAAPSGPLRGQLSGGDPRSLGAVDAVIAVVLAHPDRLDELIRCVLDGDDQIVRMRASDALEKLCRTRPSLLQPRLAVLLGDMAGIDQPSVQWHVAQMLGQLRLTARQRQRAVRILRDNLEHSTDWIVLNYSLDTLAIMARQDSTLVEALRVELERFAHHHLRSVSSRACKLRAEFGT